LKPTLKHFVTTALPITIVLIGIYSVLALYTPNFPILKYLDITALWWLISFVILFLFFFSKRYFFDNENKKNLIVLKIYLFWMVICIIRGMLVAENYWDWKGLVSNSMALLLPIVAYSATNKVVVQSVLAFYIRYGLPIFLILMILIRTDSYGFYLMPVSFLLLFLPALSIRHRVILLGFTAIVFFADLGARSNIIKFGMPFLLLIIYYLRDKLSIKTIEFIRLTMIITPFILLTLGAANIFNVFEISEYMGELKGSGLDDEGKRGTIDVTADTRTFIYEEVIQSAINNEYWIFGRTPARGNDSPTFGPFLYELTGRYERLGNEIGVANVFTWTGIVGVILYLFVFYRASYLAINRSENIYAKILGVYVSFRWLYSWIEDVNNFSINYFMLFIMVGLCFSYSFRSMTDNEVTVWVRGIFDNRYLNYDKHRKKEQNEK